METHIHGFGVGVRPEYIEQIPLHDRAPDFFEFFPHHFLGFGGHFRRLLDEIAERAPMAMHCTFLDPGGSSPLREDLAASLRALGRKIGSPYFSDHASWSGGRGAHFPELLPLPRTREVVEHMAARTREISARTGMKLALENPSVYLRVPGDAYDDAEFLTAVLEAADAPMLLDVNNVVVNARNFGGDPRAVIDRLPLDRVVQVHVAGHSWRGDIAIDTHVGPVPDAVWDLYQYLIARAGRIIPTLIEWDTDITTYDDVLDEADKARALAHAALAKEAA